jgi:rhamnogalacturonyl hydrolase YesR/lysophospholipase L1-like esterase
MNQKKGYSILYLLLFTILISSNELTAQEKFKREDIEWLDVWIPDNNSKELPRVLLIGNSITKSYYKNVVGQLKDKAYIARMTTSKSLGDTGFLKELTFVLSYHKFDVIHFNNGLHGWNYTDKEYSNAFPQFYSTIKKFAPNASLIWANTTPVRSRNNLDSFHPLNERVIQRNQIAETYFSSNGVLINDLYSLMKNNIAFYSDTDGIHPTDIGTILLATQVADHIKVKIGIENNIDSFPDYFSPNKIGEKIAFNFIGKKHYLHGGKWIHYAEVCTWLGALRFAQVTKNKELIKLLQDRFDFLLTEEYSFLPPMNHVDLNMFGCLPLELYKITKDKKYFDIGIPYAETQWQLPPNATEEERLYSENDYSWQTRLWIDDMFMITIIQNQAFLATGNNKYIDRAAKEMVYYLEKLQCPNGLFYHAADVPFYWARGNGWMAAGMTELLKVLPKESIYYSRILDGYKKMMTSLKEFQGGDGMWNQLIDKPNFWPETSGSAMFSYAIITGVKKGWLDKVTFEPVARKAWLSLASYLSEEGDVKEVCVGTNKKNDEEYYLNRPRVTGDFHGQAPYLWCVTALLENN